MMHPELLIHSYFNIVKREMIDMVPKAISLTLVNHSKENLQQELLQELYKPEVLDDLLRESEHVVSRRREVVATLAALNKADESVTIQLKREDVTDDTLQDHCIGLKIFLLHIHRDVRFLICFMLRIDLCF
jgi:Dynamin GTPase effector domain